MHCKEEVDQEGRERGTREGHRGECDQNTLNKLTVVTYILNHRTQETEAGVSSSPVWTTPSSRPAREI